MLLHFRHSVPVCLFVFVAATVSSQVLTKSGAGFIAPESILITNNDQLQIPQFYNLSYVSAQDVDGDGKLDLMVGLPTLTNGLPVTTTYLHNLGDQNFQVSTVSGSSYCTPYYSQPPVSTTVAPFCTLTDLNGDGKLDRIYATETVNSSNPSEVDNPKVGVAYALASGGYSPTVYYSIGGSSSYVSWVTTGDFNGDGLTDIAVLTMPQNPTPGTGLHYAEIYLLTNDGAGGFIVSGPVNSGVFGLGGNGTFPQAAAIDMNGDGKTDLMVYDGVGDSLISIFFGTLTGLSEQPQISQFQDSEFQVEVASDLNHDGYGDLVVLESDGVHILLGGPGGKYVNYFDSDQLLPVSNFFNEYVNVVSADFNGDGLPDLAVSSNDDVTIYAQQAGGTFTRLQQYPSGGVVAAGDFNGDGRQDLAVGGNPVKILYGQGNGYFLAPSITANVYNLPFAVAMGDFNHDGIPDIASMWIGKCTGAGCTEAGTCNVNSCSNLSVSVFYGTGQGWFSSPVSYHTPLYTDVAGTGVLVAGDINDDGYPDIVAINPYSGRTDDTAILLGNANGTFSPAKGYSLGEGSNGEVFLRDMDNDGKLDLVSPGGINYGNGNGTFGPMVAFPIATGGSIAIGDFNGDRRLDVLANYDNGVELLEGQPGRTFKQAGFIDVPCPGSCPSVLTLAAGDLNNDGKLDFAAVGKGEIFTFLGNGSGTFHEVADAAVSLPYPFLSFNGFAAIEDMNGDGYGDVVLVPEMGLMPVYLSKGNGELATPLNFPVDTSFLSAPPVIADVNGDHEPDVVVAAGSGFARMINGGRGSWPPLSSLPVASAP